MKSTYLAPAAALLAVSARAADTGYQLNLSDEGSIKLAAKGAAQGLLSYYSPNETDKSDVSYTGTFPRPYYWDESGSAWDTLIHYWAYTGDESFNKNVTDALVWQSSNGFMPANQTQTESNDAQSNWALAALSAAERGLPEAIANANTTATGSTLSWLSLAQTVFEKQVLRWDDSTCNGGLRWQIFTFNNGYNYKSTLSNAQFFQLSARLAMFTGNATYTQWAEKSYDWAVNTGLITEEYRVFDGAKTDDSCASVSKTEWSNNAGVYLYGSAVMYNVTSNSLWLNHSTNFLSSSIRSFTANDTKIIVESACEQIGSCNTEQQAYKATFIRNLAATSQLVPSLADTIKPILQASAQGAAKSCNGGSDNKCQFSWQQKEAASGSSTNPSNGMTGLGEQMNAVEIFGANLVGNVKAFRNMNTTTPSPSSSSSPSGSGNGTASPSPAATQKSSAAEGLALGRSLQAGVMVLSFTLAVLMFL